MMKEPRHGTSRRYHHGPDENDQPGVACRCVPCTTAATRDMKLRRLRGPATVDAEPVRRHVRRLKEAGLTYRSIAAIAGVQDMVLYRLLWGERARNLPPSRRMRAANARALLSVRAEQVGGEGRVLGVGSQRRLQALARSGWPTGRLGQEIGLNAQYIGKLMRGEAGSTVTAATARAVADCYDRLWSIDPVTAGVAAPKASQVRTMAAKRGWLGVLAWDDDLIDLAGADLEAKLAQQVALMDDKELQRCNHARTRHGDKSPLVVAASREYERRRSRKRAAA
jgi:transcriptional regulator with XRE-family HTH domain